MKKGKSQEDYIISKINNVLRGDATEIKDDHSIPLDEKMKQIAVIEEFKHYIDNYEENIKLINKAIEYNLRIEDDGR